MTIQTFLQIAEIQVALSLAAALMVLPYFKRRSIESKLVGLTFLFHFIAFWSLGLFKLKGKHVNIPQSLMEWAYVLLLTVVFNRALKGYYRKFFIVASAFFAVLAVSNIFFIQQTDLNTYTMASGAIILIIYCILYCYRLLVDMPVQHLQRVPMFWFNSAVLIFNAGTLFLFLFRNYFIEVLNNDMLIYWTFHNILNIIQTSIVMVGLWQDLRNTKSPSL